MEGELYKAWRELFPEHKWPGAEAAAREMATEIRGLRCLTDTIVTTALEEPQMRSVNVVNAAHDVLVRLAIDRELCDLVVCKEHQLLVIHAASALCWVLRHDGSDSTFARMLEEIAAQTLKVDRLRNWKEAANQ